MEIKKLYTFSVTKTEQVAKQEIKAGENGEKITVETLVDESVEKTFHLAKPQRSLVDESRLFYGVQLAQLVKRGLLTNAQLAKEYANNGGVLSEPDKKNYLQLYMDLVAEEEIFKTKSAIPADQKTDEDKKMLEISIIKLADIRRRLQEFELAQVSLFEETAESHARNKIIIWWVLQLAHQEIDGKITPIFAGNDYRTKLENYYYYDELDDKFWNEIINRFMFICSIWYLGKASTQEEFDSFLVKNPVESLIKSVS